MAGFAQAPWFWLYSLHTNVGGVYTTRWEDIQGPPDQQPLLAWLRRVRYQDSPLWIEARWHPAFGLTVDMKGLEHDARKTSIDQARKGIALLKALEAAPGGRPPEIEDKAAFWQFYWDSYQKVLEEKRRYGNKLPTKTEVAAEMMQDRRTLKRNRDRHHLPWPPLSPP
jgi:hypothetical protein